MNKSFKWKGFIRAENMPTSAPKDWIIFGGNFFMELILPNALKLNSLMKLKVRLEKYVSSHRGKQPQRITVNKRQAKEYVDIFPKDPRNDLINKYSRVMTLNGIPMYVKTK